MITFDGVTKQYPDGTVAVDSLTLDVTQLSAGTAAAHIHDHIARLPK